MKRKIFGTFAIIAIAVVAGYNVYTSMNKEIQLSNLALSNVAQGEWGQGMPKYCFMNKSVWYCIMQRGDTSCYCEM